MARRWRGVGFRSAFERSDRRRRDDVHDQCCSHNRAVRSEQADRASGLLPRDPCHRAPQRHACVATSARRRRGGAPAAGRLRDTCGDCRCAVPRTAARAVTLGDTRLLPLHTACAPRGPRRDSGVCTPCAGGLAAPDSAEGPDCRDAPRPSGCRGTIRSVRRPQRSRHRRRAGGGSRDLRPGQSVRRPLEPAARVGSGGRCRRRCRLHACGGVPRGSELRSRWQPQLLPRAGDRCASRSPNVDQHVLAVRRRHDGCAGGDLPRSTDRLRHFHLIAVRVDGAALRGRVCRPALEHGVIAHRRGGSHRRGRTRHLRYFGILRVGS